jgi:two-component system response regulator LytT
VNRRRLTTLVVDDEKLARRELKRLLKSMDGIDVMGEAANGIDALDKIQKKVPDLVFLDIEMPGLSGLQVVEKLIDRGISTKVIIVTAYDHYAIKAFEVNAVDYLLKPIVPERLEEAVERVRSRLASGTPAQIDVGNILATMNSRRRKLSLRSDKSVVIIDEEDLIFAYVEKGTVTAVTKETTGALHCQSLDELQDVLGDNFIRTHRRYIVNINMIKEVIPWFSGTYRLRLKNGVEIPLSRSHARELRQFLVF